MAWIELHQSLPQHRKLLALRDALGLRTPAALGHMCLLWLWALDNAPDGDLSALPARQLAEICQFSERRAGDLAVVYYYSVLWYHVFTYEYDMYSI